MRISEFGGEAAIIGLIESKYGSIDDPRLVVGFGDDAALLRTAGDRLLIVTTDLLIEGTHFRRDSIDPYSLGWKATAVNISDIAAMGGLPTWGFASIAVPDVDIEFIEQLYEGMDEVSRRFGSRIIGGDTNKADGGIVINVAQLGEVEEDRAALRSTAKPGDKILITGSLGESYAGLKVLEMYGLRHAIDRYPEVTERHIRPVPRVAEARAAVETGRVHAMMDISDGLAVDLRKMCEASGVGARIRANKVPVSDALRAVGSELNVNPIAFAASGGEDYELLIATAPEDVETVIKSVHEATSTIVTLIGEFTDTSDVVLLHPDGKELEFKPGWEHF